MNSLLPCEGNISFFHPIPYIFFPNDSNQKSNPFTGERDNNLRFWIHVGLVCFGFICAVISLVVQIWKPLPYGKFSEVSEPCQIPIRPSWTAVHIIPGFVIFTITYFTGSHYNSPLNIALYLIFVLHYLTRGVMSLISRYSQSRISIWVAIVIFSSNVLFHYLNADFIGSVNYCRQYYYDPRFILGAVLFLMGFIINRVADIQLFFLRKSQKDHNYFIPRGMLFSTISCPNYFGEGLLWLGWAILTWSLAGLVWWLFLGAFLLPRSRQIHIWYRNNFNEDYPSRRKAILPFVY